jgi:hypothetical protein
VLTLAASIDPDAAGLAISSQGTVSYDSNHDGSNDATLPTDDPTVAGSADPTVFLVSELR